MAQDYTLNEHCFGSFSRLDQYEVTCKKEEMDEPEYLFTGESIHRFGPSKTYFGHFVLISEHAKSALKLQRMGTAV